MREGVDAGVRVREGRGAEGEDHRGDLATACIPWLLFSFGLHPWAALCFGLHPLAALSFDVHPPAALRLLSARYHGSHPAGVSGAAPDATWQEAVRGARCRATAPHLARLVAGSLPAAY